MGAPELRRGNCSAALSRYTCPPPDFFGPLFPPLILNQNFKSSFNSFRNPRIGTMAPTNTRSSSISSASTSSSKCSNDSIKKKFGCNHPGCGKSFSRSEHLHRHALNHKDGNNTCMRCSAHFRRRDLLGKLAFLFSVLLCLTIY